jgi:hypothetical protein
VGDKLFEGNKLHKWTGKLGWGKLQETTEKNQTYPFIFNLLIRVTHLPVYPFTQRSGFRS